MRDFDPFWLVWPPPGHASPRSVALAYLAELARRQRKLAAEIDQAVADAVAAGADWGEVGRATGRTRQGARQRWARRLPEPRTVAHDDLVPEPVDAPADHLPPYPHLPAEAVDPGVDPDLHTWIADDQAWDDQPPEDPWEDEMPLFRDIPPE